MKNTIRLASLLLAFTTTLASAAGEGWLTDFNAAKKQAASENKDLLVDFTGSDWCSWCIKLSNEVFKHDAFSKGVADSFILVEIDYPQDKSGQSEALQTQNKRLQTTYAVQGYPTILLMDAQGRPYAQTGYQPGGPENYVTHLNELQSERVARDTALTAADQLEGVAKASALVEVLKTLPADHLSHYSDIADQISKLDPEDQTGFVAEHKLKEAEKQLEEKIMTAMRDNQADTVPAIIDQFILDQKLEGEKKQELLTVKLNIMTSTAIQDGKIDEALAMVDAFITEHKLEGERKQQLLGIKVGAYMQVQNYEEAGKALDAIIAVDPETEMAKQAKDFKPRLLDMKENASKPNPPHGAPGHVHGAQ